MQLLKLGRIGCTPCKLVAQYLESKQIKYQDIDVDENPDVAAKYRVMSVPVTILLDDEVIEVKRTIGYKPNELDELISQL